MNRLYFCDGKACKEESKQCCYTQGYECHHTTDIQHSLSTHNPNFPPTKFVPMNSSDIQVEMFDEEAIFQAIKNNHGILMVAKTKD